MNLSGEELDENKVKHLNLGPKLVPTENRKRQYMDFIQATEICALDLERKGKFSVAESLSIYPFDKGTGFVVIKEEDAIQKIEEQIGKSKVIHYDPTPTLLNKFLKELAKLRKESKFDNKTYFKLYPSYAIPPRLYGVIKAHKPEKNYPMMTIVSTIGTAPYGTSKYLVENIQPTLNKNKRRVMNSSSFVNEAVTWETAQEEI